MTLRKQVKYNAKRCLCNNWGKAISIVMLNTAVYLLFAIIEMMIAQLGDSTILMSVSGAHTLSFILSLLMSIGSFLLMVPLNLGIMRWYHSLSDGVSEDIMGIFSCFANRKMFFRSLWLSLNTGVRIALTSTCFCPPSALPYPPSCCPATFRRRSFWAACLWFFRQSCFC